MELILLDIPLDNYSQHNLEPHVNITNSPYKLDTLQIKKCLPNHNKQIDISTHKHSLRQISKIINK